VHAGLACHYLSISRGDGCGAQRLGFSYDTWSSGLHGVLMFFATCSLTAVVGRSTWSMYSTAADTSGEPVMRNARPKARRRIAAPRHCWLGCSQAPRPGRLPAVSTETACPPFPVGTETTRSSSTASSRLRQPTHVRTGPLSVRRCAEAEVSRWITAQSTVIYLTVSPVCLLRSRLVLGGLVVAADIDAPPGQTGRQPGILSFFADGERQLEVGDNDAGGPRVGVDDAH
jgi:hypothetical protein